MFQETEGIVSKLYHWAEHADNPLKSYAIGLLGAAMEVADIAANWRDHNAKLVRRHILLTTYNAQQNIVS